MTPEIKKYVYEQYRKLDVPLLPHIPEFKNKSEVDKWFKDIITVTVKLPIFVDNLRGKII